MTTAALEGVRVLELGEGVSAPFCAKVFSDYGASVIKVEKPGSGDTSRHLGPFPNDEPHLEKSGLYFNLNSNKQSITLDVSTEKGKALFLQLLESTDVLIENNLPSQMKEWGLDYASIAEQFPDLIVISITPFGQTGPYSKWKGTDLNAFHLTAAGSRYCGKPDQPPLMHGTFSADYFGAYTGIAWGLAALYGRDLIGGGQQLDVSCAESIAAIFTGAQNIGGYAQDGKWETRTGVGMPLAAPATILPCKDGYVWMIALTTDQWHGLKNAMGNPEWADLEMFDDMFTRAQNADLIYSMMIDWTMTLSKQEIMDVVQENGVPSTAVFTVADAADHPHLKERGFIFDMEHPALGTIKNMGAPIKLCDSPGGPVRAAPLLGEHNDIVFKEKLKISDVDYGALNEAGVI